MRLHAPHSVHREIQVHCLHSEGLRCIRVAVLLYECLTFQSRIRHLGNHRQWQRRRLFHAAAAQRAAWMREGSGRNLSPPAQLLQGDRKRHCIHTCVRCSQRRGYGGRDPNPSNMHPGRTPACLFMCSSAMQILGVEGVRMKRVELSPSPARPLAR